LSKGFISLQNKKLLKRNNIKDREDSAEATEVSGFNISPKYEYIVENCKNTLDNLTG
jgi:hypothetical protein